MKVETSLKYEKEIDKFNEEVTKELNKQSKKFYRSKEAAHKKYYKTKKANPLRYWILNRLKYVCMKITSQSSSIILGYWGNTN